MRDLTGRPAPAFSLPDFQGDVHTLDATHGRWRLLVFHRHLS